VTVSEEGMFGRLLQDYRAAAGMTQAELAELAGLSRRGIGDLERGARSRPYPATVRQLADALSLNADEQAALLAAARFRRVIDGPHITPLPLPPTSFVGRERDLMEVRRLLDSRRLVTLTGAGGSGKTRLALGNRSSQMVRPKPMWPGHHNLPASGTALVGRDQDVASLNRLVLEGEGRVVTLTGVGGCGKTRLAIKVASELVGTFRDGVWLVGLAPLTDPLLVPQAVASVLGVHERADRTLLEGLVAHVAQRQLLLVLDNCEHLVQSCAELAEKLLQGAQSLRLLATSREPLHIAGEVAWRVPALAFPEPHASLAADELGRYPAVQLFAERATAVSANFALTPRRAPLVAAICARLEGLPLAIELAAAWVRSLGLDEILERLGDSFGLLVGGSRTAPTRQQTLRATLDWSYGLLEPPEQSVFLRLSVFVGGWGLDAAEGVCSGGGVAPHEVLGRLTRLVDSSLVQVEERDERARYRLLEPVRQYTHERLVESGELNAVRRQHARFFMSYAERWQRDANGGGSGRQTAHAALEQERDNLRAALRWCVELGEGEMGLRLGRAHWSLWVLRGAFGEGRAWVAQLTVLPGAENAPTLRALVQCIAATLALRQGGYAETQRIYTEALPLLRQSSDFWLLPSAFLDLGLAALHQGHYPAAKLHFDEALIAARAASDVVNEAVALHGLGWLALVQEAYPAARARCEESLAVARAAGDAWAQGVALTRLGYIALRQGDFATARQLAEDCLAVRRQIGERYGLAYPLEVLGQLAIAEGQLAEARAALRESLQIRHEFGDGSGIADSLESIGALMAASQPERAVQLAGAAARIRETIGTRPSPMGRALVDRWIIPLRQVLDAEETSLAWEAGRTTPLDRAIELALAATETLPTRSLRSSTHQGQQVTVLSPREQQVAALLAHGLTNREIAVQLVVTERTIAAHIEHVLDKLGFASRHQIGAWAVERGMLG
jgi:predicted ATPase/DNA-binding CsgD family transcriptional regulator/tetratricopeptide (TPR) repeat protein/DNA-binding XRE family transcriptional regulator